MYTLPPASNGGNGKSAGKSKLDPARNNEPNARVLRALSPRTYPPTFHESPSGSSSRNLDQVSVDRPLQADQKPPMMVNLDEGALQVFEGNARVAAWRAVFKPMRTVE
jgi:hypothetical protein